MHHDLALTDIKAYGGVQSADPWTRPGVVALPDDTLVIPGHMAYGAHPPPGAGIAPNETLVFTVDLVDVSWR
jgi:hypothetical protein